MAKHTFKYADKSTIEFDDEGFINIKDCRQVAVTFPADRPNGYGRSEYIWVKPEDYALWEKYGYGTWPVTELKKVRVGVLRYPISSCNFPRGIFIPYRFAQNGYFVHAMDGLRGEFIYHEDYKPVEATKEE